MIVQLFYSDKEQRIINWLKRHSFVVYSVGNKVEFDQCVYRYIEFINPKDDSQLIHYDCDIETLYTAGDVAPVVLDWVSRMNKNKGGK